MGLDVSHDCWNGAYSAFMRFRSNLAAAIGIDIMNMENFGGKQIPWPSKTDEPLVILLNHSDCDGTIAVEDLIPLADRLDQVAKLIEAGPPPDDMTGMSMEMKDGALSVQRHGGHLTRNGGTVGAARTFAKGCRLAASRNEIVDFH